LEAKSDTQKEFYVGEWNNIPKGYLAIQIQVNGLLETKTGLGWYFLVDLQSLSFKPEKYIIKISRFEPT
jgi:hypothetical protein